jgi:NAD(P)-dependent dehydrogenase (short-subunit alcohol dehydrogenase family)
VAARLALYLICRDYKNLEPHQTLIELGKIMDLNLVNRKALITGGSGGIGSAIAKRLAVEGVNLFLVSRDSENLERVRHDINSDADVQIDVYSTDISLSDSIIEIARLNVDVDIVINCAGNAIPGSIEDLDEETWRRGWNVKLHSAINVARSFYPLMKERGKGVIVNIGGQAAAYPTFHNPATSTCNIALENLAKSVGSNSLNDGIRMVTIHPGLVETPKVIGFLKKSALQKFGTEERWREIATEWVGHRAALPSEIADVVAFVVSDRASYLNGTSIIIDGGHAS